MFDKTQGRLINDVLYYINTFLYANRFSNNNYEHDVLKVNAKKKKKENKSVGDG